MNRCLEKKGINMRNYGKDYKKNGDGYEYVGAWYETSLPAAELKQEAKFFGGKLLAASLLLACGLSAYDAAACAVWLHGAAADRAAARRGEYGMLPQDIFPQLGRMFAENDR